MRAIPRFLAPSILKSSQRGKFAPEPKKPFFIIKRVEQKDFISLSANLFECCNY
jgi:hypothetical protein